MTLHQYDSATAKDLMAFAYGEYAAHQEAPYEIRADGVYVNEESRNLFPSGFAYNWTPADEMDWPDSPNPSSAPFLPIPFNGAQLAAAMLDGVGLAITTAMEYRMGYPLDKSALSRFSPRARWMRDALAEAYALATAAQSVVGAFDYEAQASAYALACQYDDAIGVANEREGVFDHSATEDERRARRERAMASVQSLKDAAQAARSANEKEWRQWRTNMVRQLLRPVPRASTEPVQTNQQPTPPARKRSSQDELRQRRALWWTEFENEEGKQPHGAIERTAKSIAEGNQGKPGYGFENIRKALQKMIKERRKPQVTNSVFSQVKRNR